MVISIIKICNDNNNNKSIKGVITKKRIKILYLCIISYLYLIKYKKQ